MFHNDSNLDAEDGGECRNLSVFVVKKTGVTDSTIEDQNNHQEEMPNSSTYSNRIINVVSKNELPPGNQFDNLPSNQSTSTASSPILNSKKSFVVQALVEDIPKTSTSSNRIINVKAMPKTSRNESPPPETQFDDIASNQMTNKIPKTSTSSIRIINVEEMPKTSTHSNRIINIVS